MKTMYRDKYGNIIKTYHHSNMKQYILIHSDEEVELFYAETEEEATAMAKEMAANYGLMQNHAKLYAVAFVKDIEYKSA